MISKLSYTQAYRAIAEASIFANSVLEHDTSTSGASRTVYHDHYHWGPSWSWRYLEPAYCFPKGSGSSSRSEKSEKKDQSWVVIPVALIAMGTLFLIGQNHAEWSQAKESMAKLRQKSREVGIELTHVHPALKNTVQRVFEKEMAILDQIRSNAATGLVLKGILFASLIATGVGGLATGGYVPASLEPALIYGGVSSFITSCAMLYRAGFSSMDTSLKQDARELKIAVDQAAGVLQEVIEA